MKSIIKYKISLWRAYLPKPMGWFSRMMLVSASFSSRLMASLSIIARATVCRPSAVQANDLVNKILPKYQPLIDNRTLHTKGGDFRTVYDLETVQPKPEYLAIYNKVKAELREMGLPIK